MKQLAFILLLFTYGSASAERWKPMPEQGNRTGYYHNPHAQVRMAIVDTSENTFIRIGRWDNEANISVQLPFNPDSVLYLNEDSTKVMFGFPNGMQMEWYQRPDGCSEYAIILNSKPTGNSITLPFMTENLKFWLQDTMLVDGDDTSWCRESDGCFVPDSVINSYAVYYSGGANNEKGTGKAFHLYRIKAYDSDDDTIWLEQEITHISGNTYNWTISWSPQWFNQATYPVTIDPTFGYNTGGGSEDTFTDFQTYVNFGFPDTTGEGIAVIGSVYVNHGIGTAACSVNIGFYDYDAVVGNCDLIGEGNKVEIDNAGNIFWVEVDLNPDVNLIAAEGYIVAFEMWESAGAALRIRFDAAGGWGDVKKEAAPVGGTFGMDATMTGFTSDNGRKYSVFFAYTTGGAAPTGQVIIVR